MLKILKKVELKNQRFNNPNNQIYKLIKIFKKKI